MLMADLLALFAGSLIQGDACSSHASILISAADVSWLGIPSTLAKLVLVVTNIRARQTHRTGTVGTLNVIFTHVQARILMLV